MSENDLKTELLLLKRQTENDDQKHTDRHERNEKAIEKINQKMWFVVAGILGTVITTVLKAIMSGGIK